MSSKNLLPLLFLSFLSFVSDCEEGEYSINFTDYPPCITEDQKPSNFYKDGNEFKPCYETCSTCSEGGDAKSNKCDSCAPKYMFRPEINNTKECVVKCTYSYYYTFYGQYKCHNTSQCPEDAKYLVREKNKCIDDCINDDKYKYLYNGECLSQCPEDTQSNNYVCQLTNKDSCTVSNSTFELQLFLIGGGVSLIASTYAKEFNYTSKHISIYQNSAYLIILYKDSSCIKELIDAPVIDFGECYGKVQKNYSISDYLIVALIEKYNSKGSGNPVTSYSFFHPKTGEKLDAENICKDDVIVVKENLKELISNSENSDKFDEQMDLIGQDINIFDAEDRFFTDICYHFESPNGKDVALADRLQLYFPNITLCDDGCNIKGINLTGLECICECKFNDIMSNSLLTDNALVNGIAEEFSEIIKASNILVIKCYKDLGDGKCYKKSVGSFILIGIIAANIIFSGIFFGIDSDKITTYIYYLTEYYVMDIVNKKEKEKNNDNLINNDDINVYNFKPLSKKKLTSKKEPPKRKTSADDEGRKKLNGTKRLKPIKIINQHEYLDEDKGRSTSKMSVKTSKHNTKRQNEDPLNLKIQKFKKGSYEKSKELCGNVDLTEYLNDDLDTLDYDDAIKKDTRKYCEYLSDRLKSKQIFMDTFFNKENVKPLSIKSMILLLNVDLYFIVNGLFFSESYVSERFHDETPETFFSFIPRAISRFFYTTCVSVIVTLVVDCIFIEEKKIKGVFLREKEDPFTIKYEISVIIEGMIKRYKIFIIVVFFMNVISWYYVFCFNNVYPHMTVEWIKSSIAIIIIMQILSTLLCILESSLRFISFRCKSEKIYKVSLYLQ